jgi:heme/copper-type cytochrome/quinol oxidase subunit 3
VDNPLYWPLGYRDTVRETSRGCYSVTHGIYIYYLLVFMLSESILFTTLSWAALHVILSSYHTPYESQVPPEPYELAYGTALLLSGGGAGVGTVYTSRDSTGVFYWSTLSPLVPVLVFMVIQVGEFGAMGVYTNDSCTGSTCISISGLHLIHVLYGVSLGGPGGGTGYSMDITPMDTVPMDIYSIMEYSYWHLVEMVYIYIYIHLYYYYQPPPTPGTHPLYQPPKEALPRCPLCIKYNSYGERGVGSMVG